MLLDAATLMPLLTNLNGYISETAQISVLDRGFLYGDSVYEVIRTFRGKHFGLKEHLARLRQSAKYLYMTVPWTDAEIQSEVEKHAGPSILAGVLYSSCGHARNRVSHHASAQC